MDLARELFRERQISGGHNLSFEKNMGITFFRILTWFLKQVWTILPTLISQLFSSKVVTYWVGFYFQSV